METFLGTACVVLTIILILHLIFAPATDAGAQVFVGLVVAWILSLFGWAISPSSLEGKVQAKYDNNETGQRWVVVGDKARELGSNPMEADFFYRKIEEGDTVEMSQVRYGRSEWKLVQRPRVQLDTHSLKHYACPMVQQLTGWAALSCYSLLWLWLGYRVGRGS